MGHRLVATSGTDIHGPPPANVERRAGFNVVYAEELSEDGILAAIRKGHSYISAGPELHLNAMTESGQTAMMGDKLPDEAATVTATWKDAHEGDVLRFVVDGKVQEQFPVGEAGEQAWQFEAGQAKWCNIELRDSKNDMWALTNPIFW